ncbi:hypothetical protein RHGRI_019413 [Rhododendron griersonianum]|uniref:Uncharacterized protein n=1 Tax=Rhododendron griersonianum TaxID=479676 RepID=A0AAV6JGC9_9ERIC|nr:hypothetical protein RHGRI_019413 [Rhododendron griersonianum]
MATELGWMVMVFGCGDPGWKEEKVVAAPVGEKDERRLEGGEWRSGGPVEVMAAGGGGS